MRINTASVADRLVFFVILLMRHHHLFQPQCTLDTYLYAWFVMCEASVPNDTIERGKNIFTERKKYKTVPRELKKKRILVVLKTKEDERS